MRTNTKFSFTNGMMFFVVISLIAMTTTSAKAQQYYERKSISYIDALWLATPDARKVQSSQVHYMLRTVKDWVEIPRFDYNPLPDNLTRSFVREANSRDHLNVTQLAELMEKHLVPTIVDILETTIPERGAALLTEEQKQGFLATKAREVGITLDEIEKVMNSAYIYLPVLTGIKREKKDDRVTYSITGGIIWFHISTRDEKVNVRLRVANTTSSFGIGSEEFAWTSAVDNFARNLRVATQEIPEFKLGAPISEVKGRSVSFRMGRREGVRIDDTYWVGEYFERAGLDAQFRKIGWVKVSKVIGENSSAQVIKAADYSPGMQLMEHPRLGIDIAIKPGMYPVKISRGLYGPNFYIDEDYEGHTFGIDIDAHYNIANIWRSPQWFFTVGANVTFPNVDPKYGFVAGNNFYYDSNAYPSTLIWGLNFGLLKRWYFNQLAFHLGGSYGLRFMDIYYDKVTESMTSGGFNFNTGLEYATSPNFNIGVRLGWQSYSIDSDYPDVDHSGAVFGLYMHVTPPSLGFDPLSYLRGTVLGE